MSMNSHASLFYGVVISPEEADRLIKKLGKDLPEDVDSKDTFEVLEVLGSEYDFDAVFLGGECIEPEDTKYGIAVWEETTYDWEGVSEIKLPKSTEKLDVEWAKVAAKLKLGRKKPKWFQFTEFS